MQDVVERINRAFELFFANVKCKVRCSPPKFKKFRRYKSFTLKQTGWKLDEDNLVTDAKNLEVETRTGKSSNNRRRARLHLARLYKKAANQRHDFHFKLARELCLEYDTICIEDLNVKAMQRLWSRKISDLAFGDFVRILKYEASKKQLLMSNE